MKMRRHHNNKGFRQIQRGRTRDQVERMAKRLGVPIEANSLSRQKGNNLLDTYWPRAHDTPANPDSPDWTRGVTLLELLRFHAESYIKLHDSLSRLQSNLHADEFEQFPEATDLTGNTLPLSDTRKGDAERVLKYSRILCAQIKLQICVKHIDELLRSVGNGLLGASEIGALMANVRRELSCQFFIGIAPERQPMFEDGRSGWEDVITAFPATVDDIEEMNKCYALCRYPAAVFHSLMVVEHGLVALGPRIGATDPKEGWDASCRQLDRVIKAGRGANTSGLEFDQLDQLNACAQAMKASWRNKVSHATGKPIVLSGFGPDVADEIMKATRGFMRRLAMVLR